LTNGRVADAVSRDLSLLNGFALRVDGMAISIPASAQRVLAFLGLNPGGRTRVFVAGSLWTEASDERSVAALRTALWRLGSLGSQFVHCEGPVLSLVGSVEVDLDAASRIARECLEHDGMVSRKDFAILRDAGELVPDWYDDWVLIERESFRQLRLHALEALCVRFSGLGRYCEATEAGLAAVTSDPLRESAHRALVAAHIAAGNASDAVRQYRLCRRLLRRDLDIVPSEHFERLMEGLRAPTRRGDTGVTRVC
jgi:DNA-binding SARP family transcriptional activator